MTARSGGGRVRQRLTAGVGAVVLVVVVLALNFYQLPVVALSPGPAEDVLSRVKIEGGTQVYDSKGRFYLTSVGIDDDVHESKVLAAVVALRKLGYTVDPSAVNVTEVRPGAPADGKLRPGDRLVRVDGRPVSSSKQLQRVSQGHHPGETLALTVRRGDADVAVRVPVALDGGQPRIGVVLHEEYGKLPVPVSINTENIGGPSAGLMFALSIYDRLTPGDLTGGRRIAGTGQITEDGSVVPIGGIGEKIVGAKRQGATMFLLPRGNCGEAEQHPPLGLRLVPVSNVADAIAFLQSKPGDPAPRC